MGTAIALSNAGESRWTFLSGKMKGAVFALQSNKFVIGRNADCELIIDDPKCSRRQAEVSLTPVGFQILSLVNENPVIVNGKLVHTANLNDGDIILLGETEVQFKSGVTTKAPELALAPSAPQRAPAKSNRATRSKPKPQKKNNFFVVVLVIGGLFYWLLSSPSKKQAEMQVRTEKQIQADVEAAEKLRESAQLQAANRDDLSLAARQAQEHYVRGFRDYKKGQYERSLVSFQTCLALNPEHGLCNRYFRLSQRKYNELVQYEMVLGRKYRDQNQFRACAAAFRNVMVMIKDENSATYKESKANFETCQALMEGRF